MICKRSNPMSDKRYKPILLQVCITDLLNLAITFFYMPVYIAGGDYAVFYTTGFFNDVFQDAPIFTMLTFRTWFFLHILSVCSPAVQFLYRYLVLCREWTPSYRFYAVLLSVVVLIVFIYSLMSSLMGAVVYVSRSSNTLYREFILTPNPSSVDLPLIKDSISQWFAVIIGMVEILVYVIIVVCGFKIWLYFQRHFRIVRDSNGRNRHLQRQVNYVLLVQALLPIVGHLLPVCISKIGNLIKADVTSMPFIYLYAQMWIMNANPLFTILLIESYRRMIFGCCSANSTTTSTIIIKAIDINASP